MALMMPTASSWSGSYGSHTTWTEEIKDREELEGIQETAITKLNYE